MWDSRRPQLTRSKIWVKNKNICQNREPSMVVWAPTYHSQWCRQQGYCSVHGPNQGVETFLSDEQKANLRGSAKPGIENIKIKYKWLSSAWNLSWRLSFIFCGLTCTLNWKNTSGSGCVTLPVCLWEHHHDMLHSHTAHKKHTVKSMFADLENAFSSIIFNS